MQKSSPTYCLCLYFQHHSRETERFSYLIMTRGEMTKTEVEGVEWDRLIAPVQRRTRHVHCWLCTRDGELQHHVVTASKYSRCPVFFISFTQHYIIKMYPCMFVERMGIHMYS